MMPSRFLAVLAAACLLLAGCQHPDGHVQARAAQSDLGRTSTAINAADAANAQAQADTAAGRTLDQQIDAAAAALEKSR